MAILERVYTVDDVARLEQQPMKPMEKIFVIDGELLIRMAPAQFQALAASEVSRLLGNYAAEHGLGKVFVDCGYHPPGDRQTLLFPDVSFEARRRAAKSPLRTYAPYMPDLAVEVISPAQTLAQARRKAQACLRHGVALVRLLAPLGDYAEVWRGGDDGRVQSERIAGDGSLSGEDILPGFRLPLSQIFYTLRLAVADPQRPLAMT